ncbi:hypothetical protein [Kitasatospora sp. NPDC094016]|uniref:hypothetical protein n=1 Tax=Kitasatospora sp. NPDC094016 TaxID=3154986 RepID=UPI003333D248
MASNDARPLAGLVHERWRARQAPHGDFIVFGDGSLSVMRLMRFSPSGRLHDLRAQQWSWWELLRATAWTPTDWTDVDTTFATSTHAGSRALAGEASEHGGIGRVAPTRDDDENTLERLAPSCSFDPATDRPGRHRGEHHQHPGTDPGLPPRRPVAGADHRGPRPPPARPGRRTPPPEPPGHRGRGPRPHHRPAATATATVPGPGAGPSPGGRRVTAWSAPAG